MGKGENDDLASWGLILCLAALPRPCTKKTLFLNIHKETFKNIIKRVPKIRL